MSCLTSASGCALARLRPIPVLEILNSPVDTRDIMRLIAITSVMEAYRFWIKERILFVFFSGRTVP